MHGASTIRVEVKVETARSSEVPVSSYKITWYYNEEQPVRTITALETFELTLIGNCILNR
jgi:hypothetical protein